MRAQIEELKERFIAAKSDAARDAIREEMRKLCDTDAVAVGEAAIESIKATNAVAEETLVREKLHNILPAISVSYLAKTYFRKSPQWFYQKLNGNIVNGKPAQFTKDELEILHHALLDISQKINISASVVF